MNNDRKARYVSLLYLVLFLSVAGSIAYSDDIDPAASMNGRYSEILQKISCPDDVRHYGEFREYGYRAGETWCGVTAATGYLVWVSPNWYVWRRKARSTGGNNRPHVPGYDANQSNKERTRGRDCRPVHTSIVVVNPC